MSDRTAWNDLTSEARDEYRASIEPGLTLADLAEACCSDYDYQCLDSLLDLAAEAHYLTDTFTVTTTEIVSNHLTITRTPLRWWQILRRLRWWAGGGAHG